MTITTLKHISGCLLCGADIVYGGQGKSLACVYCGEMFETAVACANGHYVCDRCHSLSAMDLIECFCGATDETDPIKQALQLMSNPSVKMHGPEHHFLVPAVLVSCYCNLVGDETKPEKIMAARKRAEEVMGGFCGSHGACGAAIGAGITCSVITGTTPLSREGWRLSNLITATCLDSVAEAGGPRCCKRNTFLTIMTGVEFLNKHLAANIPVTREVGCRFARHNRECIGTACSFYPA